MKKNTFHISFHTSRIKYQFFVSDYQAPWRNGLEQSLEELIALRLNVFVIPGINNIRKN